MATSIFVNLPVKDLARSKEFFGKLGYSFNPQFTDDNAACMVISDTIYAMLLTHKHFAGFVTRPIADATQATGVIVALSADSKDAVKRITELAFAAGASPHKDPADHGFMYQTSFQDPDGHVWEHVWMDPTFVQS
jgi:predicted lactoylglutathione lyase